MTSLTDAPTADVFEVTEPGVYDDIPSDAYHSDPVPGGSLSHSGSRRLLPPSCPALYRYELTHPPAPKDHLEFGTAVHTLVFGTGAKPVLVEAPNWLSKAAQDKRRGIRESGDIPMLPQEMEKASTMATTLRRHPLAAKLLAPESGKAEQSLFWRDAETGIMRRARIDWLPDAVPGKRLIVPDYKTAAAIDDESISRAIHEHGYHTQADWYEDGIRALGIAAEVAFLFIFQMKSAPFLVRVVGVPESARVLAAAKNRRAIETYRDCVRSGRWPGYPGEVAYIEPPAWASIRDSQEYLP